MQNHNQEQNSQLPQDPVVLERVLLHYLELQKNSHISSSRVNMMETVEIYPEETNASKPKLKPNLLSIYAIATTLLLVPLSFNYAQASSSTVTDLNSADPNENLEALVSLQGKIEKLEAQIEVSTQVFSKKQPVAVSQPVVKFPPAPTTVAIDVSKPISSAETQLLPVPFLPPPIFTPTTKPLKTNPLPIPQPTAPSVSSSYQPVLPTPEVVRVTSEATSEEKWLGQTSAVYFSSTFDLQSEQSAVASASLEEISLSEPDFTVDTLEIADANPVREKLETNLAVAQNAAYEPDRINKIEVIDLNSIAESKVATPIESNSLPSDEELAEYLADSPLLDDLLVKEKLGTSFAVAQSVDSKSEADKINGTVEVINLDLLAKAETATSTESNSLPTDEELAKYLASAPLLDDLLVKEKLGTSFAVAQSLTSEPETDKTSKTVEVINLDLLAKADRASTSNSNVLPSDEELAKYLASAPLLDDVLVKEKLETSFASQPGTSKQASVSDKTIPVINLSLLPEEASSNPLRDNSDLTSYLIVKPSGK